MKRIAKIMLALSIILYSQAHANPQRKIIINFAKASDYEGITDLLRSGVSPDSAAENGRTLLFDAVDLDDATFAQLLLLAGATVDHADNAGITPLGYSVQLQKAKIAELLLLSNANPNHTIEQQTLLELSFASNNCIIPLLLLNYGALPSQNNPRHAAETVVVSEAYSGKRAVILLTANQALIAAIVHMMTLSDQSTLNEATLYMLYARDGHINLLTYGGYDYEECVKKGQILLSLLEAKLKPRLETLPEELKKQYSALLVHCEHIANRLARVLPPAY
jgi:ankyrin repeat protein